MAKRGLLALASCAVAGAALVDSTSEHLLSRVAFGSCNKQWLPQDMWDQVRELDPELLVLSGDAYYTHVRKQYRDGEKRFPSDSLEALRHARDRAAAEPKWTQLREGLREPLLAVFDDHDRGVNDGGGVGWPSTGVADREARKDLFLDFVGVAEDDPRRRRDGVYSSHVFGSGRRRVKVILLDTRHNRGPHVVPAFGATRFLSQLAPVTRLLSAMTGLVDLQTDEMLGEAQWEWLNAQLEHSASEGIPVNLVVSSVQVFTSNPMVESWGHFPGAQDRLVRLLQDHDPQGLVILSGDVHLGEALALAPEMPPIEFTSSGLTHDCSDNLPKALCKAVWAAFPWHRPRGRGPALLPERNFGTIDIEWRDEAELAEPGVCPFRTLRMAIRDSSGAARLQFERHSCATVGVVLNRGEVRRRLPWQSPLARGLWISSFAITAAAALTLSTRLLRLCGRRRAPKAKHE